MNKRSIYLAFFVLFSILIILFIMISREKLSLEEYPSFFIKDGLFTARMAVIPTAYNIVIGSDFAFAVELLRYEMQLENKSPLLLTLEETKEFDSDGNLISDQDLIILGNPCDKEASLINENYISCDEWQDKPYHYEINLQKEKNSIKMYILYKEKEDSDIWGPYEFLRDYISMKNKIPSRNMKICFSKNGEVVKC